MSESKKAKGGFITADGAHLRMERVGVCINGHCLYRFLDGTPEHAISAVEVQAGDRAQLLCLATEVVSA